MSISRLTQILEKCFTNTRVDSFNVNSMAEKSIYLQKAFTINKIFTINTGITKYFLYNPTAIGPGACARSLPLAFKTTDGPVIVKLRVGHDYTSGTVINASNRDHNSLITAQAVTTQDPTGSDTGTSTFEYLVGSTTTPQASGGGAAQGNLPFLINTNITYLLEVINGSGENITFELRHTWCEI